VRSSPDLVKPKTMKLLFVAYLLSRQHYKEKEQKLVGSESGYNVSEWGNMSISGMLFQWARTIKI